MQVVFTQTVVLLALFALGGTSAFGWHLSEGLGLSVVALCMIGFAPVAGWVSDRFAKQRVIFMAAAVQVVGAATVYSAALMRNMPLVLVGVFVLVGLGVFLSPAKLGISKELLGSRHLGFAAGIQQAAVMLAILCGQMMAVWGFNGRELARIDQVQGAWLAAHGPLLFLLVAAVLVLLLAFAIPRTPAQGGGEFQSKLMFGHVTDLADLWRDLPMRRASFGVAVFWGFLAFVSLWAVRLDELRTGGSVGLGAMSVILTSMVVGAGVAAGLMRKRIELGWVPLAGLAMTGCALVAAFMIPETLAFLAMLGLLAFSSMIYHVPLAAWMQDRYPAEGRGRMQAAVNLQNGFAGIIGVVVFGLFEMGPEVLGISTDLIFRLEIGLLGVVCGCVTWSILRLLPGSVIRLVGGALIRSIYRIEVINPERIPPRGGALLLPNHVTFADGMFISAASPRPVRFVMDEAFMASRAIRFFVSIFDTVTIRRDQPREAIRITIDALKKGDLVCLFPEGQLTRTGALNELRRGFELIAKKAGHPLIPMWCDGSWGSIFSFERGRFFRKWPHRLPYGMTVAFGREIRPEDGDLETVRRGLLAASVAAVGRRFESPAWGKRTPKKGGVVLAGQQVDDGSTRRRMWVNGYQIGQVNGLQRRQPFHVLNGDSSVTGLAGVLLAFPELFGAECKLHEGVNGDLAGAWVGGDPLRRAFARTQLSAEIVFYDFGEKAMEPILRAGLLHCPCLAVDGVVIAMSMPHPPKPTDGSEGQRGHKLGTWGKLLPGWVLDRSETGTLMAYGPAAPENGLLLPGGCFLDAEGFLGCGKMP
ncbi:MAG: MFS transporter [Luteolibacter sp.]